MKRIAGLEYEQRGDGEPVLFIHGAFIADTFAPMMRSSDLDGYRLIRYRRRGHAGSDAMPAGYSIADQARDARELLDALGVKRAHVVGHSLGGVIAMEMALSQAEAVGTLSVLEPACHQQLVPELNAPMLAAIQTHKERYRAGDAAGAARGFLSGSGRDQAWEARLEAVLPGSAAQAIAAADPYFETEDYALHFGWQFHEKRAQAITQPVLWIGGELTAPFMESRRERLAEWVPQLEGALIPNGDHLMLTYEPGPTGRSLAEFFGRHPLEG
jgi:pimeloyl-ACP methyl ester carboxylesterase